MHVEVGDEWAYLCSCGKDIILTFEMVNEESFFLQATHLDRNAGWIRISDYGLQLSTEEQAESLKIRVGKFLTQMTRDTGKLHSWEW